MERGQQGPSASPAPLLLASPLLLRPALPCSSPTPCSSARRTARLCSGRGRVGEVESAAVVDPLPLWLILPVVARPSSPSSLAHPARRRSSIHPSSLSSPSSLVRPAESRLAESRPCSGAAGSSGWTSGTAESVGGGASTSRGAGRQWRSPCSAALLVAARQWRLPCSSSPRSPCSSRRRSSLSPAKSTRAAAAMFTAVAWREMGLAQTAADYSSEVDGEGRLLRLRASRLRRPAGEMGAGKMGEASVGSGAPCASVGRLIPVPRRRADVGLSLSFPSLRARARGTRTDCGRPGRTLFLAETRSSGWVPEPSQFGAAAVSSAISSTLDIAHGFSVSSAVSLRHFPTRSRRKYVNSVIKVDD